MNHIDQLRELCINFLYYFVPSETKNAFLGSGRRSDLLEYALREIMTALREEVDFVFLTNFCVCARDVQNVYIGKLLEYISKLGYNNKKIKAIEEAYRLLKDREASTETLKQTEQLINAVEGTTPIDLGAVCGIQTLQTDDDLDSLEQHIRYTLKQFFTAYDKYTSLVAKVQFDKWKGGLQNMRPFMLEFYNFFSHYSLALLVDDLAQKQRKGNLKYVAENLGRAEKHLHRGVMDIYKTISIILLRNDRLNLTEFNKIINARHNETILISSTLDAQTAAYRDICDSALANI